MLSATPPAGSGPLAEAADRLNSVRAQLDEIITGLNDPTPCPPVLRRIYAIQDQLHAIQRVLVRHHLNVCLQRAAQAPDAAAAQQVLAEIQTLYDVCREVSHPHAQSAAAQ
jgi:DNA-binding FrmR family transcriptional regulator